MKGDKGVHQQEVLPKLNLEYLCQTAYEQFHPGVPVVAELIGQDLEHSCQNIDVVHLQMEDEDAVTFDSQEFDGLMRHFLKVRQTSNIDKR